MPRPPRFVLPGQPLHLIHRGNNRSALFLSSEEFRHYRQVLHDASVRTACAIHAYVLMTNHVHLLVTPTQTNSAARLMQTIGRAYVHWFNNRHRRSGTLWEGRYRSTLIDSDEYLLACSRYIELNPVRAGMAAQPENYSWSSFRHNACGEMDPLVTSHALYDNLGAESVARCEAYRALFRRPLDCVVVDAIRQATQKGTVLGRATFTVELERALERRLSRWPHGGDRRSEGFRQQACVETRGRGTIHETLQHSPPLLSIRGQAR